MGKFLYRIEVKPPGKDWGLIFGEQDSSREYMRGRFTGFRDKPGPRLAYRLVKVDPANPAEVKVLEVAPERTELSVGLMPQSLGHQWASYASAAARALRVAAMDVKHAARNNPALQGNDILLEALATEAEALVKSGEGAS